MAEKKRVGIRKPQRDRERSDAIPVNAGLNRISNENGGIWRLKDKAYADTLKTVPDPLDYRQLPTPEEKEELEHVVLFGSRNGLALRPPKSEPFEVSFINAMFHVMQPVYVDERQEMIYTTITDDRNIYDLILGFYEAQRRNFKALYAAKLVSGIISIVVLVLAISIAWAPQMMAETPMMTEEEGTIASLRTGSFAVSVFLTLVGSVAFRSFNGQRQLRYFEAMKFEAKRAGDAVGTVRDQLRQREQAFFTNIMNVETDSGTNDDRKKAAMARHWSVLADVCAWRVRLLADFADIAAFKIRRRFIWIYGFLDTFIRLGFAALAISALVVLFGQRDALMEEMRLGAEGESALGADPFALGAFGLAVAAILGVLLFGLLRGQAFRIDFEDITREFASTCQGSLASGNRNRHDMTESLVRQVLTNRAQLGGRQSNRGSLKPPTVQRRGMSKGEENQ